MNPSDVLILYCYAKHDRLRHFAEISYTFERYRVAGIKGTNRMNRSYNPECKAKIVVRIVSRKSNSNVARRKALCVQSMAPRLLITFFALGSLSSELLAKRLFQYRERTLPDWAHFRMFPDDVLIVINSTNSLFL